MAPDPLTQERLYRSLKSEFLAGKFVAGARVEIAAIADRHRASVTPVREAIHRLIGEDLLESRPDGGFQLVIPDPEQLTHLYRWNGQMLLTALHLASRLALREVVARFNGRVRTAEPNNIASWTNNFFHAIGQASENLECAGHLSRLGERLHYARLVEPRALPDIVRELDILVRNGSIDVKMILRRRIVAYHRRRIERAHYVHALAISRQQID